MLSLNNKIFGMASGQIVWSDASNLDVVYYNQQTGALHAVCWSKSSFPSQRGKKAKKCKK